MNFAQGSSSVAAATIHLEVDAVGTLARWIVDQVNRGCSRVVLAQKIGENGLQRVDEWPTTDLAAHSLAQFVYAMALREAQTLRASMAYVVFAVRGTDEPVGRYLFRVDGGSSGWMQGADTPDERGITSMLMRHTEASTRLSLGHSREMGDQYERLIEILNQQHTSQLDKANRRIEILEAREIEALELREKVQTMASERQVALADAQRRDENQKYRFDKALGLVTVIASRFRLPGSADAAAASRAPTDASVMGVLRTFVQSITAEQLHQLVGILRPEQIEALSAIWDAVGTREGVAEDTAPSAPAEPTPRSAPASSASPPAAPTSPVPPTPASSTQPSTPASVPAPAPSSPSPSPAAGDVLASPASAAEVNASAPAASSPANDQAPANDQEPEAPEAPAP